MCGGSAAGASNESERPTDWSTYSLVDVRNPGSPVALVEFEHHRNKRGAVLMDTRLLMRSGSHWRDATPRRLKWWIEDAYFLDRRRGWIVTSDCAAGTGAMYRTRDGGRTWRRLSWGFTHNCAAGSGFRLMFVDRRHGWVANPTPNGNFWRLFRTRDGGRTWTYRQVRDMPELDEVTFRTRRVGWGIGLSWLYRGPLYRTTDAGRTWKPEPRLPELRYSVPVFSGSTGIVMGTRRGTASFFRTRDGRRWQAVGRLDVHGLRFPDFRAPTERTWWVFGVCDRTPVVLVTTDSGRHWTRSTVPNRAYYVRLAATKKLAWVAATPLQGEGALFSSGDLGRTWSRVTP